MSLLHMSMTATVMILVIIFIRALVINHLPKVTFVALWGIVLARLLIPFSLPSSLSIYSMIDNSPAVGSMGTLLTGNLPSAVPTTPTMPHTPNFAPPAVLSQQVMAIDPWFIAWLIGAVLCALYFTVLYLHCRRKFSTASRCEDSFVTSWLGEHKIIRKIRICTLGSISAPLTYGILHPVILLPRQTDLSDTQPLHYVLEHEYVHIRRFDAAIKLLLTVAVCIHWFNPCVWLMYALANRDIELSCDQEVVCRLGADSKSDYALALISMEERKSGLVPFYNSFGKNSIKERIGAIMRYKKASFAAVVAAFALVLCVTTGFATSAKGADPLNEALNLTASSEGTSEKLPNEVNEPNKSSTDMESLTKEATSDNHTTEVQRAMLTASSGELFSFPTSNASATLDVLSDNKYRVNCEVGDLIYPMRDGTVTYVSNRTNQLNIDYGGGVSSRYQNVDCSLVNPGELVTADQPVATLLTVDGVQKVSFVFDIRSDGKPIGIITASDTYAEYLSLGLTYNEADNRFYLDGEPVRYFEDKATNRYFGAYDDGTYNVYIVRDASGAITGIDKLDIKTAAVDIKFREYSDLGLTFNNSMELNGTPISEFTDVAAGIAVTRKSGGDNNRYEAVRSASDLGPVGVGRLVSIRQVVSAEPSTNSTNNDSLSGSSYSTADAEALDIMQRTGNWGYIESYLPKMTNAGIDAVVRSYNSKHPNSAEHKKAADYYN